MDEWLTGKGHIGARNREIIARVADEARLRLEELTKKFQNCLAELTMLL